MANSAALVVSIALILHIFSVIVWVGGMFFAVVVLRPACGPLDPGLRLALWRRVLAGFFPWVFAAIALLLVTGFALFLGGYAAGEYVHMMMGIGIFMMLIFGHIYFAPWKRFRRALDAGDNVRAAAQLNQIRIIVTLNLLLGLLTAAIGSSGPYWG